MKDESVASVVFVPTERKRKKHISHLVCSVITYFAFAVIILLAIPTCLLIGAIGGIWTVSDKIVRAIEQSYERPAGT